MDWGWRKGKPVAGLAAAQGGGTAGSARSRAMAALVLRQLSRFADARGVPPGWEFLLDYDVIEAFCVTGLRGRVSSAQGTYRSALYRLAGAARCPAGQRAAPFAGAKAPAPYSPAERAELAAAAAAQRDLVKRAPALALVVFGTGAGLRPGELVALRGSDVTRHGRQVVAQVSGPAARVVPATAGYADRAWELACRVGSDFVFRPGPADCGYKNFVTSFALGLAADPAAPRLSMRRARSSFICGHLAAGTPVRSPQGDGPRAAWMSWAAMKSADQRGARGPFGDDPAVGQVPPLHALVPQAHISRISQVLVGALPVPHLAPGVARVGQDRGDRTERPP